MTARIYIHDSFCHHSRLRSSHGAVKSRKLPVYVGHVHHISVDQSKPSDYGTSKTLLTVDLTEEYQALYPEAGITKAVRREYTSANAK